MNQIWSYILTAVGVTGFFLAGRKIWWAWYVNIANQAIWITYAVATKQWGFLIGAFVYLAVFVPNAIRWTKDRYSPSKFIKVGMNEAYDGLIGEYEEKASRERNV